MSGQNKPLYIPADTGKSFWGPSDRYTFLVTGAQSDNAYFIMEAIVPPAGGPPPHIHAAEQEAFYLLDGTLDILMGDKVVQASTGDFVHIPAGTIHCFRNTGNTIARVLVIFSPGGLERFFESTLEKVLIRSADPPQNTDVVIARYLEAGPRFGITFV